MRQRRRTAGLGLLLVVATLATGLVLRSWLGTRHETARTAAELRDERRALAQAEDDLAAAGDALDQLRATLDDEQATLELRRSERDAAQAALDSTSGLLTDVQAQLETATTDLAARQARLDALVECVTGAVSALNQASVSDVDGLTRTLRGIEATCARAGATL